MKNYSFRTLLVLLMTLPAVASAQVRGVVYDKSSGDPMVGVSIVVKENNLSFIAVVKSECSPLLIVDFITQIISVLKTYIGTVNEVKIRGNFSIVYQVRSSFIFLLCSPTASR